MKSASNLPENTSSVFIIIPVHNRRDITLQCLKTLYQNGDLESHEVVVVDDGSTDGTAEAVQASYPLVKVLYGNGQLWWTGAIEKGMRYAKQQGATHIIWLNDDCLVPEGTFQNLVKFIDEHPQSIIGGQGYSDDTYTHLAFGGKYLNRGYYQLSRCKEGTTSPCDMLSGNLVCLPQSVIEIVGFPKTMLPHYGGDTLYLIQARKAGFKLFVDARTAPIDIPGNSDLQPVSWMLEDGEPFKIIKLIFQPQSILSWRVWWVLLTSDHGIWGSVLFILKYFLLLPKLAIITSLRLLPIPARKQVMLIKKRTTADNLDC